MGNPIVSPSNVENLESELQHLTGALQAIEAEREALDKSLDMYRAAFGRTSAPDDQQQLEAAERRYNDLNYQAGLKCAAIDAVRADLNIARDEQAKAEIESANRRIREVYRAIGKVADDLDKDIRDMAAWRQLVAFSREHANLLYEIETYKQKHEGFTIAGPQYRKLKPPHQALGNYLSGIAAEIGQGLAWLGNRDLQVMSQLRTKTDRAITMRAALGMPAEPAVKGKANAKT
jgi:chromosome segregation ATPase